MAMEGTQSLHNGSLSEVQHSQSSPPPGNERTTHTRFLLSNAEAGSVIGRGGSTVNDFQSQSGARIQLSRNFEYFPGTADRVAMVSGTVNDTLKAIDLILTKLLDEFYVEDGAEVEPQSKIRLIVPNGSCGGIIGKGGAIIKSLIEDSQTGIKISPQDDIHPGLHDRIVTVTGTLGGQMRAIELILLKLVEDPYYQQSASAPFPYAAVAYNGMNYGPNGVGGNYQNNGVQNQEDENSSTTIGVADEHIGLVVGRGGRTLTEISQLSGARIKISDRGDFMVGTSDRKVTITGPQRAIHIAESMIARKVASVSER